MEAAQTFIMAGGEGTRLLPLTAYCAKPAVGFGPGACLLDLTILNCLRSGLKTLHVLAQYRAESIAERILTGWRNVEKKGVLQIFLRLPLGEKERYMGTADAVRKNLDLVPKSSEKEVLILAGDHIYDMDYRELLSFHKRKRADLTVAVTPVPPQYLHRFGVLSAGPDLRILCFKEKPKNSAELEEFSKEIRGGIKKDRAHGTSKTRLFASMGIYVFRASLLHQVLSHDPEKMTDFGANVIPALVGSVRVFAFPFVDRKGRAKYWRDVGTLDSYFSAQLDLIGDFPPFRIRVPFMCAFSRLGAWVRDRASQSLVSLTSRVEGRIKECIVSPGVRIEKGAYLERCVLLERAYVGKGVCLSNAVIDKGTRVECDTGIPQRERLKELQDFFVLPGMCVISQGENLENRIQVHRVTPA